MKITVQPNIDIFTEGSIVALDSDPRNVFLVTCRAVGYDDPDRDGTFWAIGLTGNRVSAGNFRKDLFHKFSGSILIEA